MASRAQDDTTNVSAAASLAKSADLVVLVLGTDIGVACENRDAVNITFSDGQLALVEAVAAAASKPVTVVTLTAVPLDLTPLLNNPKVGAILHAGQPSVQTLGVADLLFGAVSPAGRAIQMVYPESYQHQISPMDFNMRPGCGKNRIFCAIFYINMFVLPNTGSGQTYGKLKKRCVFRRPSHWPRPDSPGPCTDPMRGPIIPNENCSLGTNPVQKHASLFGFPFTLSFGCIFPICQDRLRTNSRTPVAVDKNKDRSHTGSDASFLQRHRCRSVRLRPVLHAILLLRSLRTEWSDRSLAPARAARRHQDRDRHALSAPGERTARRKV